MDKIITQQVTLNLTAAGGMPIALVHVGCGDTRIRGILRIMKMNGINSNVRRSSMKGVVFEGKLKLYFHTSHALGGPRENDIDCD